jgi:hypothetical protein
MNIDDVLFALMDCAAMLEATHIRNTTGRGPSYSDYRGQVASTIRTTKLLIEELKKEKANGL